MDVIDLRSDTITKPTDEMRRAMAEAEVGDDVFREDPSINRLQERAAELMGKEAGLLTASGTMGNLVAILTHTQRGDEIVMGDEAHIFWNEGAGVSALAGAQTRLVPNGHQGRIDPVELEAAIRPPGNIHFPPTTLICLENTHNRCSGGVLTPQDTKEIADIAHAAGAKVHLDGARIFNALDSMIDRLAEDHANARRLAEGLANIDGLEVDPDSIQTNIVIFDVDHDLGPSAKLIAALDREGVKVSSPGPHAIRMVTHRHISGADVEEAVGRVSQAVKGLR